MKKLIMFAYILSISGIAYTQPVWELKKEKDGIKVFTGSLPNSDLKAVKVTCVLNASLSQLTALLLDSKAHEQWVYDTKTSYLVKQMDVNHLIYYTEIEMPWPLSNRDVVVDLNISQDAASKVVYVCAKSTGQCVAVKSDKVRVPKSSADWTVRPIGNNQISIEYVAQADPGGSLPTWIVNSFSTKGPFETFKKLKALLASPAYQNAQYAFIKD